MGSNKNEPQDVQSFGKFIFFLKQFSLCSWNWGIESSVFVNHYRLFTLCVFDYSHTHRHCPCHTSVFVREQPRGHASPAQGSQTHKRLHGSVCVCVCARCTDHCFLDVCGRFFLGFPASSTDLGAHFCSLLASSLSWQRVPVQLCSCDPSPTALWSWSSGWQGGEVCQAELFAAQISEHPCVSQEVAPLSPLSFPWAFCVSCKHLRNFQPPQLRRAQFRGLLFCVCGHQQGEFTARTWNENDPRYQTNKHSLIHSAPLLNCSRFCELTCIINYRVKIVRIFVLPWEVPCTPLFLFVVVQLPDWEEHQNAYGEGDDVCSNIVGRYSSWDVLRVFPRERGTSGMCCVSACGTLHWL